MSNRVSQIILLCEDDEHRRLALAYLNRCGVNRRIVDERVASRLQRGGNSDWVIRQFARELNACRQRQKRARTLLVVMLDADKFTVDERVAQLNDSLIKAGFEAMIATDPVALLIPRREIENWIAVLTGRDVSEEEDCKTHEKHSKEEIRNAAETIYDWTRPNAAVGLNCTLSLRRALPEWHKLG